MKKILLSIIVVALAVVLCSCGGGERIDWSELALGDVLPKPPALKGKINFNSVQTLLVNISGLSDKQYNDYIEACKEKGFTIDAELGSSYGAYNSEGYKLNLIHYSRGDMSIQLDAPIEMGTIKWPAGAAGNALPAPKSMTGKFSYEYDDSFFVYVGETSKRDYDEYVTVCSEMGFSVDYAKGDDYYYADHADGWHISLNYKGNNTMSIDISPLDEEKDSNAPSKSFSEEPKPDETAEPETAEPKDSDDLDPDFKAAMDSYETIMNEYIDFMKKFSENPNDMTLLLDYANYMSKYTEAVEGFEKWDSEGMSTKEAAYYLEVQGRVNQKLLEIVP